MIRKFLIRTVLIGGVFTVLVAIGLTVAGLLACRTPDFYAEVQHVAKLDQTSQAEIEKIATDFRAWSVQVVSSKSSAGSTAAATHTVTLNEQQINTLLAEGAGAGDVRNVRVKLTEDGIQLGAEVGSGGSGGSRWILSAELKPSVSTNGTLQFEIYRPRLGCLRIPLQTVLSLLPDRKNVSSRSFRIDASGSQTRLLVNLSRTRTKGVVVNSVQCSEGRLLIGFEAQPASDGTLANLAEPHQSRK